ncbi:MAG: endo-1,4-beta-xylanase [Culturomica sp.]|jgi:endo-1,4-beta-xylanase|nr:endo-1,4-beta-xylanase [Culturomica sp.]
MNQKFYYSILVSLACLFFYSCGGKASSGEKTLKDAFKNKFYIGTAMNERQIMGQDTAGVTLIKAQFDAIVPENCMKSMNIHPEENRYVWDMADAYMKFGEDNNMWITGHCLIWHSQLPFWFCWDENRNLVSPEVLKKHMKDHISTVVGRYKGRIKGWDVVNEAIMEDGSYRNSAFYQILGEEFIDIAFQYAQEADPDCELYYNDYNEWYPAKRATVVKLIQRLKSKGIRIDAIGMQGHVSMDSPTIAEYEATINEYKAAGVKVMVTELDMSALPEPKGRPQSADISAMAEYEASVNPYPNGLPDDVSAKWNQKMGEFFALFLKHQDVITRVTAWGDCDANSWKNGFPVRGRVDYALLFDRNHQPKPVVEALINGTIK